MRQLVAKMQALLVACLLAAATCAVESRRPVLRAAPTAVTTGNYVVVLRRNTTIETLQHLLSKASKYSDDAKIHRYVGTVEKAFTLKLSPYSLEVLRRWPEVDYIEEEHMAHGTQSGQIPWHLDRIDQRLRTLDYFYQPIATGAGVDVYIVDTGINYNHEEFENRATYSGYDAVDVYMGLVGMNRRQGLDCFGHGTHVASLCGGKTFGSAKGVNLLSLRALDCSNMAPYSVVLDALDYIARTAPQRGRRAIVSMSLAGENFQAINDAVINLYSLGIPVIVAAGNNRGDACSKSPASSPYAITVGGTRNGDGPYVLTNYGSCVTILSPGQNVLGADYTCNNCSMYLSGTSMAAPIVSGVAAMLLQREPSLTPAALRAKLLATATIGAINISEIPVQYRNTTPNKLVYIPGSCGGTYNFLDQGYISSPNFPAPYPENISCVWTITGVAKLQVQLNVTFVNLEAPSDTLKVCSQPSCSGSSLLATLTGDLGNTSLLYFAPSTGASLWVSLQIISTNSGNRTGFKASFIKIYTTADLPQTISPTSSVHPQTSPPSPSATPVVTTPPSPSVTPVVTTGSNTGNAVTKQCDDDLQLLVEVDGKTIESVVIDMLQKGYKVVSIASYHSGPSLRANFDVLFTNSSSVDTVVYIQITEDQLLTMINNLKRSGYSLWSISDRVRNFGSVPYYSGVFGKNAPTVETKVYLRDNMTTFQNRLKDMQNKGYQLVAQSVEKIGPALEACSIYRRDNNSTNTKPLVWQSIYNVSYNIFVTMNMTSNLVPIHLDSYYVSTDGRAYFSAVLSERTPERQGQWFQWGLNVFSVKNQLSLQKLRWTPSFSLGYNNFGAKLHYVQWHPRSC